MADKAKPHPNRGGSISRRQARRRAVEMLYEAAQRDTDAVTLLADRVGSTEVEPIGDYTVTLVEGVTARRERIDASRRGSKLRQGVLRSRAGRGASSKRCWARCATAASSFLPGAARRGG